MANSTTIPIIDVAGLFSDAPDDRRAVAREMRVACRDTGFFYVMNHVLDGAFLDGTFAQSKRFFELPLADKERIDLAKSPISRGYEPIGGQQLDLTAARDLKESFYLGVDRGPDDPLVVAETPNHGPNQWPDSLADWRCRSTCRRTISRRWKPNPCRSSDCCAIRSTPLMPGPTSSAAALIPIGVA